MSVRRWLTLSLLMFTLFVAAGYVIAFHSNAISQSSTATNLVLVIAAISLFSWPICLARAFQTYLRDKARR